MVEANGLLRIFWPSDSPRSKSQGTLIGWRNSPLDLFVVAILQNVEVKRPRALKYPDILTFLPGKKGRRCTSHRYSVSR